MNDKDFEIPYLSDIFHHSTELRRAMDAYCDYLRENHKHKFEEYEKYIEYQYNKIVFGKTK